MNVDWTSIFCVLLVFWSFIFFQKTVEAEPPTLGLPIDCSPGVNCWLLNLVDHDPGTGVQDFRCADYSYDGHKGTDIAIRNLAAMRKGVAVRAAAPGEVTAFRDGMLDQIHSVTYRRISKNRYCGNGVVIHHGHGWETQYCHLRRKSIVVKRGQKVAGGEKIGLVGLSGMALVPHVHLSVRHRGRVIDPFVGTFRAKNCTLGAAPLWKASALRALSTNMTAIYQVGFASKPPDMRLIREGFYRHRSINRNAPALILWAEIFWPKPQDKVRLKITGPDGKTVVDKRNVLIKRQARRMIYLGKKRRNLLWPAGQYRGEVMIEREEGAGRISRFNAQSNVELID